MNLQLLAGVFGGLSVAAHYADAITTYIGLYKLNLSEGNSNPIVKWLVKSPARLLGLSPLPYVAYGVLAMIYGGINVTTCVAFCISNAIAAFLGFQAALHNYQDNKAAEAKLSKAQA